MICKVVLAFASLLTGAALHVGQVQLRGYNLNVNDPEIRQHLLQILRVPDVEITPLSINGGANDGVWVLKDPQNRWPEMIMKSRKAEVAISPDHLPEPEHYRKIYKEHPTIVNDPNVVFPEHIVACITPDGQKRNDLILMRRAQGVPLSTFIAEMYIAGPPGRKQLYDVLERLGRQLREFHDAYGKQHTDFQTQNVIVDKNNGDKTTIIDLGGMGQPVQDNDLLHLKETFAIFHFPSAFMDVGYQHFEKGYFSPPQPKLQPQRKPTPQPTPQPPPQPTPQPTPQPMPQPTPQPIPQPIPQPLPEKNSQSVGQQTVPEARGSGPIHGTVSGNRKLVSLRKLPGERLGLRLRDEDGKTVVTGVRGGLIALWNAEHPELPVQAGDRVVAVNRKKGDFERMLGLINGDVEEGDFVEIWSSSRKSWFTDGRVVEVKDGKLFITYDSGRLKKNTALDSPSIRQVVDILFERPTGTGPSSTAFRVAVAKTVKNQKLGMRLVNRDGVPRVKKVVSGLIKDWNDQHPDQQIKPGDRIVEVNKRRDNYNELLDEITTSNQLEILIERGSIK